MSNKATKPDNIQALVLKDRAVLFAPTLTAIFNRSVRESKLKK